MEYHWYYCLISLHVLARLLRAQTIYWGEPRGTPKAPGLLATRILNARGLCVCKVFRRQCRVGEREGGKQVLNRVKAMGKGVSRLHTIWADGGFDGEPFMQWVMDVCRWIVQVVLRPQETKGFVLLKKRWVVERTFGWLMGCRRLVRDYELLPETSETFIYLAMIRIMVRRVA